jgi:hypothetical protein
MIKLPKKIAIYPQKRSNPDYLLCWIPPSSFKDVSRDSQVQEELERYYPNGIEVELSEDGLDELGIVFEVSHEKLRRAYIELNEQGALPNTGMIEVEILVEYIAEREAGRSLEEITSPMQPETLSFGNIEGGLIDKVQSGPEMTGEEDSQELFRRLSVRQASSPSDQVGGE